MLFRSFQLFERLRDTLIIADGTSCRSQIFDGSGRQAIHVARFLEQQLLKDEN